MAAQVPASSAARASRSASHLRDSRCWEVSEGHADGEHAEAQEHRDAGAGVQRRVEQGRVGQAGQAGAGGVHPLEAEGQQGRDDRDAPGRPHQPGGTRVGRAGGPAQRPEHQPTQQHREGEEGQTRTTAYVQDTAWPVDVCRAAEATCLLACPIENVNAPLTGWESAETTCQATV